MKSISSWLIVALLIFPACEDENNNGVCPSNVDFGDPYVISIGPFPLPPEEPITLNGDTLNVGVHYSGGCRDHDFILENCGNNSTMYLWLTHNSHDDPCEAYPWENIQKVLCEEILDSDRIVVLDPNCEDSVIVKDNQD